MATIHRTTLAPTKLELLAGWLPEQPWYRDTGAPPALSRAGGFRLDDPAGDVGIEVLLVTDGAGGGGTTYVVPLSYRGAPLVGAERALVGTSEHGVLGTRWIYDAAHDPVAVTQLLSFLEGSADAQQQSQSDTPDPSVGRSPLAAAGRLSLPRPLRVSHGTHGRTTVDVRLTDDSSGTARDLSLDIVRVISDHGDAGLGRVEADWTRPDGRSARGVVAVIR
jgi:hypothetical protein